MVVLAAEFQATIQSVGGEAPDQLRDLEISASVPLLTEEFQAPDAHPLGRKLAAEGMTAIGGPTFVLRPCAMGCGGEAARAVMQPPGPHFLNRAARSGFGGDCCGLAWGKFRAGRGYANP